MYAAISYATRLDTHLQKTRERNWSNALLRYYNQLQRLQTVCFKFIPLLLDCYVNWKEKS